MPTVFTQRPQPTQFKFTNLNRSESAVCKAAAETKRKATPHSCVDSNLKSDSAPSGWQKEVASNIFFHATPARFETANEVISHLVESGVTSRGRTCSGIGATP
jgi:hypothetical protein